MSWVSIVLPLLVLLLVAGSVLYLFRASRRRQQSLHSPYNVGRQEARQAMQIDILRALGVVGFVGVLLVLFPLFRPLLQPEEAPIERETAVPPSATPMITLTPTPLITPEPPQLVIDEPTAVATPTSVVPTNTPSPIPPTNTPAPQTATVSSGVGVWLRADPSVEGEQLEWLLDGTAVTLLNAQTSADAFVWQQVEAPSGNVGWVAADFLVLNE